MFAVKAVYDGTKLEPMPTIDVQGKYEVIITFVQRIEDGDESIEIPPQNPRILREANPSKSVNLGRWRGEVTIPDDFDEPLEEMTIVTADENIQKYDVAWTW